MSGPMFWIWGVALAVALWWLWSLVRPAPTGDTQREEPLDRDRPPPEDVPGCLVCGVARATHPMPVIECSSLDRDLLGHRRLYSLTPMYVIKDGAGGSLCSSHARLARRRMEEKLQEVRVRNARFNSEQEAELAEWETGGLLGDMQNDYSRSVSRFRERALPMTVIREREHPSAPPPDSLPAAGATVVFPGGGKEES